MRSAVFRLMTLLSLVVWDRSVRRLRPSTHTTFSYVFVGSFAASFQYLQRRRLA
jgi:hypothetical protein